MPERTRVRSFGPGTAEPESVLRIPRWVTQGRSTRRRSIGRQTSRPSKLPHPCGAHTPSRRHRRLIEPSTVRLPAIRTDTRPCTARSRARVRRTPLQPRMSAMTIVVTLELKELQLQIGGRPEEGAIQAFPSNRANEPFDEGMRERRVRHRLDFLHVKDAQVRLPLMELVQPIMVRAEVCGRGLVAHGSVEHSAQP